MQVDENTFPFLYLAVDIVFCSAADLVIVGPDGYFVAHLIGMLLQILQDVFLDGVRDLVFKISQSLPSFRRHVVTGRVADDLHLQKICLQHLIDGLLEMEVGGIFLAQNEIGKLGIGERKGHLVQHIENNQFV